MYTNRIVILLLLLLCRDHAILRTKCKQCCTRIRVFSYLSGSSLHHIMTLLSRTTTTGSTYKTLRLSDDLQHYKRERNNKTDRRRRQVISAIFHTPISKRIAGNTITNNNNNNIVSCILLLLYFVIIVLLYRPNRTPVVLVARAKGGATEQTDPHNILHEYRADCFCRTKKQNKSTGGSNNNNNVVCCYSPDIECRT